MDGSAPQNTSSQTAPHQQASLIRPEQVARLPQLNPQQKQKLEKVVREYWEALNSIPQGEQKYNEAHRMLVQTSRSLMQGMKNYHLAAKQRQLQQQQAAQTTGQSAAQGSVTGQQQSAQPPNRSVQFNRLLPEIQQEVNEHTFFYPPAMSKGTRQAADWLREAKARFGQALQRLQGARSKKAELQRQAQQRQTSDKPLTPQETEVFKLKLAQCNKAITESQTFMENFTAQQNEFRNAQSSQQLQKQEDQSADHSGSAGGGMSNSPLGGADVQAQGPPAHSISSAVSAAASERNRQQQQPPAVQQESPSQPERHAGSLVNPKAACDQRNGIGATPSIPAHPLHASIDNVKLVTAQAITKNLQVSEPKPVQMPPARPTLSAGSGAGVSRQMSQPGIVTLPGYVLESSDSGRPLSKKKLNELVREVIGLGKDCDEH